MADRDARDWPEHQRPTPQTECECRDCGGVFFVAANRYPADMCRDCDASWALAGF